MRKGEKVFKVVNVKNGGVYLIGEKKLKSEVGEWTMYLEPEAEVKPEALIPEPITPIRETHEEDVEGELTYQELKLLLTAANVPFKGNASRDTLIELYEGTL
jgi:hypothetical protein